MAVKPTSLRQLEEQFVCDCRWHSDEESVLPRESASANAQRRQPPERRREWRLFGPRRR